jgi:hypothetical protein
LVVEVQDINSEVPRVSIEASSQLEKLEEGNERVDAAELAFSSLQSIMHHATTEKSAHVFENTMFSNMNQEFSVYMAEGLAGAEERKETKTGKKSKPKAGKKYKPVHLRTKPVLATLPGKFRIERNIKGDPLKDIPELSMTPGEFKETGKYTKERKEQIDKVHSGEFLWPEERKLMHDFMCKQEKAFAWTEDEKGQFREDFFPPVEMPIVAHTPWVLKNIPIPPGLYKDIIAIVKDKVASGAYEPSNSSYRSRWFTVVKKDGTSLRIVHDLQPLNKVTIADSGVPPFTETIAESFGGRGSYGMLDLFVGYDERTISESSRDYTTFQTPLGTYRLTKMPMGWTNSMQIFHGDVTKTLEDEIPHVTIPFVDDVPIKGSKTRYENEDYEGGYETLPENPGIRRFVWEQFQRNNRIAQRMKYVGATFSGKKAELCQPELVIVGHRCTYEGRLPDKAKVAKIQNWGPLEDLTSVRGFLGFIEHTADCVRLNHLTSRDMNELYVKLCQKE